ncbi:PH domain-containing protein [Actinomadura mexicana]|uniref:PH domain-containing protein n=1 Tax=Actinomadura mexicana TaxID=134959 RepID=A0A239C7F4_9ACTN|nr:PH domain-containing protein [Actinomadura mexicana]SNS16040.1 PH domain-containing protein [Actinomadura mexicana]
MTIRSTGGRVAAYAWLVFAALNLIDLFVGITGDPDYSLTTVTIAFLLLLGCGIAYTVGMRPLIAGDEGGVTVRNPLRDVRAPWGAVRRIEGKNALTVVFAGPDGTDLETRAWVLQTSPRAQAKAEARAEKEARKGKEQGQGFDLRGRTPTAYAAQQLNEMKDRQRPKARSGAPDRAAKARAGSQEEGPARGTVRWSVPALASLAVPLAVVVVLLIVGAVS